MVSLEVIAILLSGISISASLFYYSNVLENTNKTRKTQLFTQIYQARYNPDNIDRWMKMMSWEWKDFDDYYKRYSGFGVDPDLGALSIAQFAYYDGLGLLVKNKMVDVETVYQLMSAPIINLWFKFETVIKGMMSMESGPGENYMESFMFLADEMIRMRLERGISLPVRSLHPTSSLYSKYNP